MPAIDTIASFFLASLLLAVSPGPDIIFVLTQSIIQGPKAGLAVMAGLCSGLVVHTTAVAAGVAAIFHASPAAYATLRTIGACYLLYLAWLAFRASAASTEMSGRKTVLLPRLYMRGVIMNITNPKVTIFFLAFLPLFAEPERGPVAFQIIGLGLLFIISTILVFGFVALTAGSVGQWLNRTPAAWRVMNIIAGIVFILLAGGLLLDLG